MFPGNRQSPYTSKIFKTFILTLIFYTLYASAFGGSANLCGGIRYTLYAEEPPSKEPIVVNGDEVEYFHEKKVVVGRGNVSITYKDVILTCDKIEVYLDTKNAVCEGNVKITQKGAYFTGERIEYNFESKTGRTLSAYVNYNPFYGRAQEIAKLGDKEAVLNRGYVTTCDLEKPHYRVQSRQIRIYFDDRVTAKHVLFFIGNVPILYIPYYVQPLKQKKTHMTVIPGESRDWGYYVLTAYRYYINDDNSGDLLLDYRTKKGLGEGINHYYDTKSVGKGSVKFYYTNENDDLAYEKAVEERSRYRFQVRHRWDMGEDKDTVGIFELNKVSDKDGIKDYFYKEYEEQGAIDNYISVITAKEDYTAEFLLRKRFDKFFNVVQRLPEFKINIQNYNFKGTHLYYASEMSGVYLNETFEKQVPSEKDIKVVRFDAYNQLSYAQRLFGSLSVTPYAGTRQTYYSRNKWGETNLIRGIFRAGVDNSVKFYRIYDVMTDFLSLDINKLRHIITPTANYSYTHQPTISPDNLNQFDSIDSIDTANGITLSLENKLQTKRPYGNMMKSVDLATLIISSQYDFRLKDDLTSYKSQKFKSVDFRLELVPYPWLYTLAKMTVNTKKYLIESESVDLVAQRGDKFSLGLGHRYENAESGKSNLLTLDATYKINDKWKARAYERFDVHKSSIEEQEYTIYRDLHCWLAELTYNIKRDTSDRTIWLVFRLKAFPETPVGFKRTYSRPSFGSTGGSQSLGY